MRQPAGAKTMYRRARAAPLAGLIYDRAEYESIPFDRSVSHFIDDSCALSRLDFVVGRTKRSAVPAIGRPAGTALRLVRPTDTFFNFTFGKSLMEISCEAIRAKRSRGDSFLLLDCREQDEWDFCHIDGAILIPMSELQSRVPELEPHRDAEIIVYCHHGVRSLQVAMWLQQQGFIQAASMAGGIEQWSLSVDRAVPRY